jgi:hypothetical protein
MIKTVSVLASSRGCAVISDQSRSTILSNSSRQRRPTKKMRQACNIDLLLTKFDCPLTASNKLAEDPLERGDVDVWIELPFDGSSAWVFVAGSVL